MRRSCAANTADGNTKNAPPKKNIAEAMRTFWWWWKCAASCWKLPFGENGGIQPATANAPPTRATNSQVKCRQIFWASWFIVTSSGVGSTGQGHSSDLGGVRGGHAERAQADAGV